MIIFRGKVGGWVALEILKNGKTKAVIYIHINVTLLNFLHMSTLSLFQNLIEKIGCSKHFFELEIATIRHRREIDIRETLFKGL